MLIIPFRPDSNYKLYTVVSDGGFEQAQREDWIHKPITVFVYDTVTCQCAKVDNISPYMWCEGNWACDCNRHMYFDNVPDNGLNEPCTFYRYKVVGVDFPPDADDYYKLADFNPGYD